MPNQFYVDSQFLSPEALARKHELENNPASRKDIMEYLPGMEIIQSDTRQKVMERVASYAPEQFTTRDVMRALEHEHCTIEDFQALLSPAAEPLLEQMATRARKETVRHFGEYRAAGFPGEHYDPEDRRFRKQPCPGNGKDPECPGPGS